MTVNVELGELTRRIGEYSFAYLVTVGESGRAHVLAVSPEAVHAGLLVDGIGKHSLANASAHPDVTLVWPPTTDGGYSLIVDGTATIGDGDGAGQLTVVPVKAILHRPAPGPDGKRTGSDCQPVARPDG